MRPTNAQVLRAVLKIVLALIGAGYLVSIIIGITLGIGHTAEPSEFTWWDAVSVLFMFLAFHWSIEWIKDLFKEDE